MLEIPKSMSIPFEQLFGYKGSQSETYEQKHINTHDPTDSFMEKPRAGKQATRGYEHSTEIINHAGEDEPAEEGVDVIIII